MGDDGPDLVIRQGAACFLAPGWHTPMSLTGHLF
jgi:hypothetical protein